MANTDITLRLDKGSSLTFNEMDTNFASFFYSASTHIVGGANKLRLFYTGSGQLDAPFNTERYTELALPTATTTSGGGSATAAGNEREIQFNNGSCAFGASSQLKFLQSNDTGARLGVGLTPKTTLDIQSANTNQPTILNLNASSTNGNQNTKAFIQFRQGGSTFAQLGKRNPGDNIIDFYVKSQLNLGTHNYGSPTEIFRKLNVSTGGVVIGENLQTTIAPGTAPLAVVGDIGIGSDTTVGNTSFIGGNTVGSTYLPTDSVSNGLLIQSPKSTLGGHVIIGINTKTSGTAESFSIVKGSCGTFNGSVATFKADGKVGIGCVNPANTLDVDGNTLVDGNLTAAGNATVDEKVTIGCIPELASLGTDWSNSNDEYTKTLVTTDSGVVQYMDAAPVPKGGIIMWSGTINNMPKGWRLCSGGSPVNGVSIPDLRNKFVVGSYSDASNTTYPNVKTGATGGHRNAVLIGHSHGATTSISPNPHSHCLPRDCSDDFYDPNREVGNVESLNHSSGADEGLNSSCQTGTVCLTASTSIGRCGINTSNQCATGQSGTNMNLPPYYALAFIIYVGVA